MKDIFKNYLFTKHILVSEGGCQDNFQALFSLANLFGIKVVEGQSLAQVEHIEYCAKQLGEFVPEPFYRGFPQSVRALSKDMLLFDQLLHYAVTYGLGDFSAPGHSVFEQDFERTAFNENVTIKQFSIVTESDAQKLLQRAVADMLASSRPLSQMQFDVIVNYICEYNYKITYCASKNTLIKLIVHLREVSLVAKLALSDVIKVVEYLNYHAQVSLPIQQQIRRSFECKKTDKRNDYSLKNLRLCNQDRKLVTALLDYAFDHCHVDTLECYERQAHWCGLLHHIHYKPKTQVARDFVCSMRQRGNKSVYSVTERLLKECDVEGATVYLKQNKGDGAVLRNLNYLLSRCKNAKQVDFVLSNVEASNVIVLLQLLLKYSQYKDKKQPRTFKFVKFNNLLTHVETEEEQNRRKSHVSKGTAKKVEDFLLKQLKQRLKNKVGKVYVDRQMYNVALPLQEGASAGGFGVMSKGSKLPVDTSQKIRAFTYWEKVNDVDLSVIGLAEDGAQEEFSWRTMYGKQSQEIAYSGDQTSGYNGGSEYFDVDVALFKRKHKKVRYLVFCNNVFSGVSFSQIVCKAGYMLRDKKDSGQVFEPKTVQTSFKIDGESIFQCLFALDLKESQFIWLNVGLDQRRIVAGQSQFAFLFDYFDVTRVISVGDFFEMMATEVVNSPDLADVIVSDNPLDAREGAVVVHSYDFEKITPYFE